MGPNFHGQTLVILFISNLKLQLATKVNSEYSRYDYWSCFYPTVKIDLESRVLLRPRKPEIIQNNLSMRQTFLSLMDLITISPTNHNTVIYYRSLLLQSTVWKHYDFNQQFASTSYKDILKHDIAHKYVGFHLEHQLCCKSAFYTYDERILRN